MTNSKNKGSKNERAISKLFIKWTGYEFARTPQSGGLHWQKQNTIGDIVCTDDKHSRRFPFSIECKFHSELDFSHLIDGTIGKGSNKVIHFWEQCLRDAEKVNKVPLLFMRKNMMKADMHFIAMPTNFFLILLSNLGELDFNYGYIHYVGKDYLLTIVNSEDFLKLDYKTIYKLAKKITKNGKERK